MSTNDKREAVFRGLSPYLYYEDAEAALGWLSKVLGFTEQVRYLDADGVVREAEMRAGNARVYLAGMGPGHWERKRVLGPVGQLVIVFVDDVDAHHARATAAGADPQPPEDKPYGARVYGIEDPGGNAWTIWQQVSDEVELEEGWQEIRPGPPKERT